MQENGLIHIFHSYAKPRQHSFRNHRHSAVEIGYIVEGEGNYQVGERSFDIRSGDIFIYHTNEAHCITDISEDKPMHLINVQFEPRYVWESVDGNAYLQTVFQRSMRGANRLREDDPLYRPILEKITEAEKEWSSGQIGSAEMIRSCVLTVLILLTRDEPAAEPRPHRNDRTKLIGISESMDYICEHLTEPITLEEIAAVAHLSRTYYCTEFKTLNGVSPWDYINIKRVEKALAKLRQGNENVLSVALSCGFNNTANFNRIFRKVTGLTPQEYRRSNR